MSKEELIIHFNNVAFATERILATKAEHLQIETSLEVIKEALFSEEKEKKNEKT